MRYGIIQQAVEFNDIISEFVEKLKEDRRKQRKIDRAAWKAEDAQRRAKIGSWK